MSVCDVRRNSFSLTIFFEVSRCSLVDIYGVTYSFSAACVYKLA